MRRFPLRRAHSRRDAAGCGDVVVFNQDAVRQGKAVVDRARRAHGVFVQLAQTGHCFARVGDARLRTLDGLHRPAGGGGHSGHMLQQVQRGALPLEQKPGAPFQLGDDVSRLHLAALGKTHLVGEAVV